jgi:hypothetical protein
MQEKQAAKVNGPRANVAAAVGGHTLKVLAVTASSAVHDILGTEASPGKLRKADGRIVKMISSVDTYYVWSDDGSGTVDETASETTTPTQQCYFMSANTEVHEYCQGRYLIVKGSTGLLRMALASP